MFSFMKRLSKSNVAEHKVDPTYPTQDQLSHSVLEAPIASSESPQGRDRDSPPADGMETSEAPDDFDNNALLGPGFIDGPLPLLPPPPPLSQAAVLADPFRQVQLREEAVDKCWLDHDARVDMAKADEGRLRAWEGDDYRLVADREDTHNQEVLQLTKREGKAVKDQSEITREKQQWKEAQEQRVQELDKHKEEMEKITAQMALLREEHKKAEDQQVLDMDKHQQQLEMVKARTAGEKQRLQEARGQQDLELTKHKEELQRVKAELDQLSRESDLRKEAIDNHEKGLSKDEFQSVWKKYQSQVSHWNEDNLEAPKHNPLFQCEVSWLANQENDASLSREVRDAAKQYRAAIMAESFDGDAMMTAGVNFYQDWLAFWQFDKMSDRRKARYKLYYQLCRADLSGRFSESVEAVKVYKTVKMGYFNEMERLCSYP